MGSVGNEHTNEHTCVVGLAWGDEGKGKIVDLLGEAFDVVVRYNGGANAGHTVCIGDETFAVHQTPVGVLRSGKTGVIGPGVVLDPHALLKEIEGLEERGVPASSRLWISDRVHLVMPYHQIEDRLRESASGGGRDDKIGTTARGIGPCYADKAVRTTAVRAADLLELPRQEKRIRRVVEAKRKVFTALYGTDEGLTFEGVWQGLTEAATRLTPLIRDVSTWLAEQAEAGKRLFFEGANGMLLDVDQGTYPYVTSSNTGPQGVAAGAGIPASMVTRVIGVTKAYSTRVGGGPFPTELDDEVGARIREQGHEYGTTTGRPRRCGWLDAVAIRNSVRLGGVTEIAVAHLDTLSGFERVGVCVAYRLDGKEISALPASADDASRIEPVYEMLEGWAGDLRQVRRFDDLPSPAQAYLRKLEAFTQAPVTIVSVGPQRDQTILRA